MTDTTALTAAVSALQTVVPQVVSEMNTLLADLMAAIAANDQPAIDAATAALQAQVNALQAAVVADAPPPGMTGPTGSTGATGP